MSISTILQPYANANYESLFTPEKGFLVYQGNWQIKKTFPGNYNSYCKNLIKILTDKKAWKHIPNEVGFKNRLDRLSVAKTVILFNSKSKEHEFLSNFYQRNISYKDHNDLLKTRSYPSSENAYQAHKAALWKLAREDLERLATLPPSESKKLANGLVVLQKTDENAKVKYELMRSILKEKFAPGTDMAQKLVQTSPSYLVENTQDAFWGMKKVDFHSLEKHNSVSIQASSSNVLGRILMEIRTNLSNPATSDFSTSARKRSVKK